MDIRRVKALIRTGNLLAIGALAAFALQAFILQAPAPLNVEAPRPVPRYQGRASEVDLTPLGEMAHPLQQERSSTPPEEPVHLIGTLADTAYLFLGRRRTCVNAYLDEAMGVDGLEGWKLKRVTWNTALFSTPQGERVLHLSGLRL